MMRRLVLVFLSGTLWIACSVDPVVPFDGGGAGRDGGVDLSLSTGGSSGAGTGGHGAAGGSGGAAVGSGGHAGSGGRAGSGGLSGSGGRTGTGADSGTGGRGGSGGRGGRSGMGGAAGVGGASGSAGSSAGGRAGSGAGGHGGAGGGAGAGGASGADCAALPSQYSAALPGAETCDPALNRATCQTLVSLSLSCPGCQAYVEDPSTLDMIRMQWMDEGCASTVHICPAIACVVPPNTGCTPVAAGGGMCDVPTVAAP
jgi:hypothetical protein